MRKKKKEKGVGDKKERERKQSPIPPDLAALADGKKETAQMARQGKKKEKEGGKE